MDCGRRRVIVVKPDALAAIGELAADRRSA
jgi:hypothetical protein